MDLCDEPTNKLSKVIILKGSISARFQIKQGDFVFEVTPKTIWFGNFSRIQCMHSMHSIYMALRPMYDRTHYQRVHTDITAAINDWCTATTTSHHETKKDSYSNWFQHCVKAVAGRKQCIFHPGTIYSGKITHSGRETANNLTHCAAAMQAFQVVSVASKNYYATKLTAFEILYATDIARNILVKQMNYKTVLWYCFKLETCTGKMMQQSNGHWWENHSM